MIRPCDECGRERECRDGQDGLGFQCAPCSAHNRYVFTQQGIALELRGKEREVALMAVNHANALWWAGELTRGATLYVKQTTTD